MTTSALLSTNSLCTYKHLEELTLSERVIRDYILSLRDCDAVRLTMTEGNSVLIAPMVYHDGSYDAGHFAPTFIEGDELLSHSTLGYAAAEFASDICTDAIVAVNVDDLNQLLIYPQAGCDI